jgi:hypothetical protein
LDWSRKVELFEEIRREYEFGIGTIAGVAKKLGVRRRMVREAIASAVPKPRKPNRRRAWKIESVREKIDAILAADRQAPRKQRHTVCGCSGPAMWEFPTSSRPRRLEMLAGPPISPVSAPCSLE